MALAPPPPLAPLELPAPDEPIERSGGTPAGRAGSAPRPPLSPRVGEGGVRAWGAALGGASRVCDTPKAEGSSAGTVSARSRADGPSADLTDDGGGGSSHRQTGQEFWRESQSTMQWRW